MNKYKICILVIFILVEIKLLAQNQSVDSWKPITKAPQSISGGGGVVYYQDNLFVSVGGGKDDFYKFNLKTKTWHKLQCFPKKISFGSDLAFDGNRYIYAIKGTSMLGIIGNSLFWRYDIQNNCWELLPNTPEDMGAYGVPVGDCKKTRLVGV